MKKLAYRPVLVAAVLAATIVWMRSRPTSPEPAAKRFVELAMALDAHPFASTRRAIVSQLCTPLQDELERRAASMAKILGARRPGTAIEKTDLITGVSAGPSGDVLSTTELSSDGARASVRVTLGVDGGASWHTDVDLVREGAEWKPCPSLQGGG